MQFCYSPLLPFLLVCQQRFNIDRSYLVVWICILHNCELSSTFFEILTSLFTFVLHTSAASARLSFQSSSWPLFVSLSQRSWQHFYVPTFSHFQYISVRPLTQPRVLVQHPRHLLTKRHLGISTRILRKLLTNMNSPTRIMKLLYQVWRTKQNHPRRQLN